MRLVWDLSSFNCLLLSKLEGRCCCMLGTGSRSMLSLSLNLLQMPDFHPPHWVVHAIHSHSSKLHSSPALWRQAGEQDLGFIPLSVGDRSNGSVPLLSLFPHLQNQHHQTFCKMPHCRSHELRIIPFRCPLS